MATSRQDGKNITKKTDTNTATLATADSALILSTLKIQNTLKHRGSELLEQSFVFGAAEPAPLYPPATLCESDLYHSQEYSEWLKNSMGIKGSSHPVDVVQFLEGGCDLVYSLPFPNSADLNQLPGTGKAAYVITTDQKIYYANKILKTLTPLPLLAKDFDVLLQQLSVKAANTMEPGSVACVIDNLSAEQLKHITTHTKHMHGMGFYKQNPPDSVMSPVEAANSTAYQLLGPRHFPTCYAIRNNTHHYVGVLSKLLPGFKPNRGKPLQAQDLEISSLKNMIKERDDHDMLKLNEIFGTITKIIPLLTRKVNPDSGFFFWAGASLLNAYHSHLGDSNNAQHVQPDLEKFIKLNLPTITFGDLEAIRQLLIKRKMNIETVKASYIARQHDHDKELLLINQAIEQLNLILLDDIALFLKAVYHINKQLEDAWVDVEAERTNPASKYINIQISEGLPAPLHISLDDILHYRTLTGLAIGLTSRYFMQDPDGHAKNLACDGRNVDGDLAVYPLIYRFKNPGRKPGSNDYVLDVNDYTYFPNLTAANFRYWPTQATGLDTSADAALSQVSDVTKNYFTKQDHQNFMNLETSPVFNFQKYVQLIIFSLTNSHMYAACAKLHMTEKLAMLNNDGNPFAPLPLINSIGQRMDLQYKWVEALTHRAQDAKVTLALQLAPVKMILARHSDLVLELVLDHFKRFIEDRRTEFNADSLKLLEDAINPETLTAAFKELMSEILAHEQTATIPSTPSMTQRLL